MTALHWSVVETPLGAFGLASSERGLRAITFEGQPPAGAELRPAEGRHDRAAEQLRAYAAGEVSAFDLPLDPVGTPFQRAVWDAIARVPFGATSTYRSIAGAVGASSAVRAVGAANGANPLPVVVPCHRIVGSEGRLRGYAGGLALKRRLLELEGALPAEDEGWPGWAARRQRACPGLLIGPRSTRIYCRPECRYTARLVGVPALFAGVDEAVEAGYRACRVCHP